MTLPAIQPYLFFNGRCEEALDFYRSALGAEVDFLMRFSESPDAPPPGTMPEGWENKIMHVSFRIAGNVLMASDGCETTPSFGGFSLSISVATKDEVDRHFHALAEGGTIEMPPGETFWSPRFGMVTDRFGLGWMIGMPADEGKS